MKAAAIGWVTQNYLLGENPGAGSYVGLSLWPGRPTAVKEDVDTVRKLIEQQRNGNRTKNQRFGKSVPVYTCFAHTHTQEDQTRSTDYD